MLREGACKAHFCPCRAVPVSQLRHRVAASCPGIEVIHVSRRIKNNRSVDGGDRGTLQCSREGYCVWKCLEEGRLGEVMGLGIELGEDILEPRSMLCTEPEIALLQSVMECRCATKVDGDEGLLARASGKAMCAGVCAICDEEHGA
uniref:Uncharacterized protein n=1 Tax=Eutreptiella gymnastica TaxID=73025 RepID=A0A7S4GDM5_9EUGL